MKDNSIQPKSSFKESKKRSSLKNNSNILDPHKIINYKRNSVSFNLESVKKFKKLKFDIGELKPAEKKILVEKKKKFEEVRRQSVKNEFNLVRDFLKNKMNNIDDLEDEDVKENTIKNITMGKEGLKSIESDSDDSVSDSHSSEENKSEKSQKSEKSENSKEEKNKKEKSNEEKSDEKKEEIKKKENALDKKIKEFESKEKEFEKKIEEFEKKVEDFDKK
jgi:hypothetical protein